MRLAFLALFLFLSLYLLDVTFVNANEKYPFLIHLRIEPVDDIVAEVEPLDQHQFTFKYYNGGNFQTNLYAFYVEFRVEVEGEGWQAFVEPAWSYFYPNETKLGSVRVVASARPSNFAYVHLYGRLRDIYGFWHTANYTFQVKSAPYHSFDVKVEDTYIVGKQEEIYSLPLKIINYGNYEDVFSIIPEYVPPGWQFTFSQNPIVISPKQEATIYIHFAIPHEGFYLQQTTYLLRFKVQVEETRNEKPVSILVSLEGFHFTLGQTVAFLSVFPSILLLLSAGVLLYIRNNPCSYIPKPWKEEKEELLKMSPEKRKKAKKEMKEAWKSAKYFCKYMRKEEKELERLRKIMKKKQEQLEEKIMDEWRQSWQGLHNQWKEECNKIKEEYEKRKRALEAKWMKAKRIAETYGKKLEKPTFPQIIYPPEPKKPPLPKIPEYKLNEEKLLLIEPDEIIIERILMPLRKNKILAKRDVIKMREMGNELREKIKNDFYVLEKKIGAEIERVKKIKK